MKETSDIVNIGNRNKATVGDWVWGIIDDDIYKIHITQCSNTIYTSGRPPLRLLRKSYISGKLRLLQKPYISGKLVKYDNLVYFFEEPIKYVFKTKKEAIRGRIALLRASIAELTEQLNS